MPVKQFRNKKLLRPAFYKHTYRQFRDRPKWRRIHESLSAYKGHGGRVFFVQIGTHDSMSQGDPVRRHIVEDKWSGLLVEPVPYIYKRLVKNYEPYQGLRFANVAVDSQNSTATMIAAVDLPNNPATRLSSFSGRVLDEFRWRNPDIDRWVEPLEVQTLTLQNLLDRYEIEHIDGLFIDTEGHDKVILDQLDLSDPNKRPHFILYEHYYLSKAEQSDLRTRLHDAGYRTVVLRIDTFAEL